LDLISKTENLRVGSSILPLPTKIIQQIGHIFWFASDSGGGLRTKFATTFDQKDIEIEPQLRRLQMRDRAVGIVTFIFASGRHRMKHMRRV
jgi:hypothetical protein